MTSKTRWVPPVLGSPLGSLSQVATNSRLPTAAGPAIDPPKRHARRAAGWLRQAPTTVCAVDQNTKAVPKPNREGADLVSVVVTRWQGKDGSKRSRHEVIAHEVVFLDAPPPTAADGRRERRHEEPASASPPHREPTLAAA